MENANKTKFAKKKLLKVYCLIASSINHCRKMKFNIVRTLRCSEIESHYCTSNLNLWKNNNGGRINFKFCLSSVTSALVLGNDTNNNVQNIITKKKVTFVINENLS